MVDSKENYKFDLGVKGLNGYQQIVLQKHVNQLQLNDCRLNDTPYLHLTSSVATWEEAFPRLLVAIHWYSPLSVLLRFVIVIFCLSFEKTILGL